MKKLTLVTCLLVISLLYKHEATAQVRVNVNLNVGSQPVWGPAGYEYAEYYYMPDIDAYYYIPERKFIYYDDDRWIFAPALPPHYHYDLYRGYKVVVNEPRPWLHADIYRSRYGRYRGWYGRQVIIRDHRDRYYYDDDRYYKKGKWKKHHDDDDDDDGHWRGRGHKHGHDHDD
ncbi:MAG TPA: hypothetical protein VM802_29740 [Chitinophaga sp.]|uniref:hypothetical protein n=1 Tax=Chitinophaga sp. TaxID=1869181 RepID=UPI002C021F14|nr:hypothetical protein [Chitinophaga sp.]HVI49086.1 hypothetical protein [Chitinophaga sp.]